MKVRLKTSDYIATVVELGDFLVELRQGRNQTQQDVSKASGLIQEVISKIERGHALLPAIVKAKFTMEKIEKAYEMTEAEKERFRQILFGK